MPHASCSQDPGSEPSPSSLKTQESALAHQAGAPLRPRVGCQDIIGYISLLPALVPNLPPLALVIQDLEEGRVQRLCL